ncbi:substrate-binding domain-containing protein [Ravibacter arvi]|uniref:Substrate-binding domain-containing protein n=1 Tax=Ravibacter arvi TaxID=2051041 RepID=A0ABP8LRQ3_9BACT
MLKKRVSLRDIAEKAGVSTALVSYVLNGKKNRVGKEMTDKIRKIAEELNYEPHHVAKSLRSGKTFTIGLIIADISNPFFANIARVVEDEAKQYGYTVIIGSSDENAQKSWDLLHVLLNRQVDGFIIVSAENSQKNILLLKEKKIPFVLLDRHFPDIHTDFVTTNNYKASYDATVHLLGNGYDDIALIAYDSDMYHMQERIRGYHQALSENHIVPRKEWLKKVPFSDMDTRVRIAIDALTTGTKPVRAILFATYGLAINGLKYINEKKIKVPDDLAIVSYGQAEVFDLYYCPISYIRQPLEQLGKTAVEMLISKLKNPDETMKQVFMEAKLIARDSSVPVRVKTPG